MPGKKAPTDGRLSIRKYAERIGIKHPYLTKLIKEGKFTSAAWDGEYFIPEVADVEWGLGSMVRNDKLPVVGSESGKESGERKVRARAESGERPAFAKATAGETGESGGGGYVGGWNGGEVPKTAVYPEALRIKMILDAEEKRLKNEELSRQLVRKVEVDRQMMVAGIEVRKVFERLPVQVVDAVLASRGRVEAIAVLEDAVSEALEKMVENIERALNGGKVESEG